MAEKNFEGQNNYGWGLSLNMTGKVPAIAKRIFDKLADAEDYINNYNESAIEGLNISVINDGENNGTYFVAKVGTKAEDSEERNNDGVLTKFVLATESLNIETISPDDITNIVNNS